MQNSNSSAGAADSSITAQVTTSSHNSSKPNVSRSLSVTHVEIDCYNKFPMETGKLQRFEAQFLVLEGDKSLTKKIIRKTWESAYAISKKWYDKAIKDGIKVCVGNGVRF